MTATKHSRDFMTASRAKAFAKRLRSVGIWDCCVLECRAVRGWCVQWREWSSVSAIARATQPNPANPLRGED
jgi:hypothetical protein